MNRVSPSAVPVFALAVVLVLCSMSASAQLTADVSPGIKPFGTYDNHSIDTVDMTNGTVSVNIPIASYPQRGNELNVKLAIQWHSINWWIYCDSQGLQCYWDGPPYAPDFVNPKGPIGVGITNNYSIAAGGSSFVRDDGTQLLEGDDQWGLVPVDGSGIRLTENNTGSYQAIVFDGGAQLTYQTCYYYSTSCGSNPVGYITDSNGNQLTLYGETYPGGSEDNWFTSIVDTLGRTIPMAFPTSTAGNTSTTGCPTGTVAAFAYNLPAYRGGSGTLKICQSMVPFATDFNYSGVGVYVQEASGSQQLTTRIILPDNTHWDFAYDSYLNLSQITTPQGGTISYQWEEGPISCNTGDIDAPPGPTRVLYERTEDSNDGTPSRTWVYSYGGTLEGPQGTYDSTNPTTTVVDPAGDTTVASNEFLPSSSGGAGSCSVVTTQTTVTNASGQLVKTTQTDYQDTGMFECDSVQNGTYIGPGSESMASILPIHQRTIWPNGQESETDTTYGLSESYTCGGTYTSPPEVTIPFPTQIQDYDYGPGAKGALLRTRIYDYWWAGTGGTAYFTAGLSGLPQSETVLNSGGTQIAATTYSYDNASQLVSSNVSYQHVTPPGVRGNLTSTSSWISGNNYALLNTTWYDTGVPYQNFDALHYPTTYGYSSAYKWAYPTTITNALGQAQTNTFDFNTGLPTSTTDPNGQTVSRSYDVMERPTGTTYPDGGSTSYCYTDLGGGHLHAGFCATVSASGNRSCSDRSQQNDDTALRRP